MKNILKINTSGIALGICLLLFSCGSQSTNEDQHQHHENDTQTAENNPDESAETAVDNETKAHVNQVLNEYYTLKSALVDTDAEKAKSAGEKLAALFEGFDVQVVQESLRSTYESISGKIHQHAEKVAQVEDIEIQRENFSDITAGVYEMVKTFNANEEEVYYAYCPMAFNNTGGYWLSDEKEIRNPYFGSKMLKCGSVKETIAEK